MLRLGSFLLFVSTALMHASAQDAQSFPLSVPQRFPYPRVSATGKATPMVHHGTDFLTMSNYGAPGILILGLGDEFNGYMIQYRVCDIWGIRAISGMVDWGDGTPATQVFFDSLNTGRAGTIKIPPKVGTFTVRATISGLCDDAWQHKLDPNSVSGTATATVYDSIPITAFEVTCSGNTPCASVKGGQVISGVVTTQSSSPTQGTLVRVAVAGPAATYFPYVIEPSGQNTVSFDVETQPVNTNTVVTVMVNSGGITLAQPVTVTP